VGKQWDNGVAAGGQYPPFSQLMGFNISANKIKMRPKSAKWDQISYLGPIFEKTPFAPPFPAILSLVPPLKSTLNVKNITYFKYNIVYLYFFRFIFVSLQRKLNIIIYVRYV
jgi:hypothetical protein